jgi:RNA polymerase sigma factor (sigma-70 family)
MDESTAPGTAETLEQAVVRAGAGDRTALESVVGAIQKDVHNLALRFLWHPQDAEDASQEILIRVLTGLSGFRGESGFRTWVYRVACNALMTLRKQRVAQQRLSFEEFSEDLGHGVSDATPVNGGDADYALLLEEVKIGCTLAMLQCLDRDHRLAYILGEIMELDHVQAAEVLEATPAAFRQRLSRARADIVAFMTARCGLVNPANACRCRRRVDAAIALGRVDPSHLLFATSLPQAQRFPQVLVEIRQLEDARRAAALYRSHPETGNSGAYTVWLRSLLDGLPGHRAS